MIDYKDFVIPEFYWDYFVREKRSLFISSYLKDNNILPSEDMIKNFIIDEKEREDFRRILYSKYCISGVMPEIPDVPVLPDNPDIPGETIKMVNVTFGIEIDDFIPFNDGIAETNNDVVNIFKKGINFMHLLEKDDRDIEVIINNDKEHIILSNLSDFNRTYNIPAGEYVVNGCIGRLSGTYSDNPIIRFNETLEIYSSGEIKLHGICDNLLIISDKEFRFLDYTGREYNSYNYNGYYYWFENKYMTYHWVKIDDKEYIFNVDKYYGESHSDKILYYYINSKNDGEKYVNVSFDFKLTMSYNDMDGFEENEELINEFLNDYVKNFIYSLVENAPNPDAFYKLNENYIKLNKIYTIPIGEHVFTYEGVNLNDIYSSMIGYGKLPNLYRYTTKLIANNSGIVTIPGETHAGLIISNGDFWLEDINGPYSRYYWNGYMYYFNNHVDETNNITFNTNKGPVNYTFKRGQYSFFNNEEKIFDEKSTIICTYYNENLEMTKLFSNILTETELSKIIFNLLIDDSILSPILYNGHFQFNTTGEHTIKITLKEKTNMNNLSFEGTCLTSIIIPENISILSSEENILTFKNCSQLNKIICKTLEPPTFPENINPFEGIKEGGLLQVRKGTKEKYIKWMGLLNNWAIQEIEIEE